MDENKLRDIVNSSGFPLQIGIQRQIEKTQNTHGWKVLTKELPWHNVVTGNNGFIDLVLANQYDTQRIVIECKRVRDTKWLFLEPSSKNMERRHALFWLTCVEDDNTQHFDWFDSAIDPPSPESEFCVVPGQDAKSKPMLERIAAELLEATEAIAYEEYQLHKKDKSRFLSFYFSVIVTTAELQICTFTPDDICIVKGEIQKAEFRKVPFVRFRKSLSTRQQSEAGFKGIQDIIRAKGRTVFVINSTNIIDFIQNLDIPNLAMIAQKILRP